VPGAYRGTWTEGSYTPGSTTLGWQPLHGYSDHPDDTFDDNRAERRGAVDAHDTWLADLHEDEERFPSRSPNDAAFVTIAGEELLVVADFFGVYLLPAEDDVGLQPGWDTPYGTSGGPFGWLDLDYLPWELSYTEGSAYQFQSTVAPSVAFCSECGDSSGHLGLGVVAMGDVAGGRFYGPPEDTGLSPEDREEAEIDCHFEVTKSDANLAEIYVDPEDPSKRVWWLALNQVAGVTDGPDHHTQWLLRSEDDGESWCWEGTIDEWDVLNGAGFIDGQGKMLCLEDQGAPSGAGSATWPACETPATGKPGTLLDQDGVGGTPYLGHPSRLVPSTFELSFLTFQGFDLDGDHGTEEGLGGLYAVEGSGPTDTGAGTLSLADLGFDPPVDTGGEPDCETWSQYEYFAQMNYSVPFTDLHPDDVGREDCSESEPCRLLLGWRNGLRTEAMDPDPTSNDRNFCSLFYVEAWRDGSGWDSEWSSVRIAQGSTCDMRANTLAGARFDPWDPDSFYVYGRWHEDVDGDAFGGVCRYDLTTLLPEEQVIDPGTKRISFTALEPHPHLEDVLYLAASRGVEGPEESGYWGCISVLSASCRRPGIYMAYRRRLPNESTVWPSGWVYQEDVHVPEFMDLSWGTYLDYAERLYVSTAGGGPYELWLMHHL